MTKYIDFKLNYVLLSNCEQYSQYIFPYVIGCVYFDVYKK